MLATSPPARDTRRPMLSLSACVKRTGFGAFCPDRELGRDGVELAEPGWEDVVVVVVVVVWYCCDGVDDRPDAEGVVRSVCDPPLWSRLVMDELLLWPLFVPIDFWSSPLAVDAVVPFCLAASFSAASRAFS